MATKLILKKSATGGSVPLAADLDAAEVAINLVDRKIYTKDNSGAVQRLDGAYIDSVAPANASEGDLWYDTQNNLLKAHNGSSFVSAGYSTLGALEDTTFTALASGEVLQYNGTNWVNSTLAEADIQPASTLEATVEALFSVTDGGGDGSLTYSSGVFTYTGPSAAETRAHFTDGTGIALASGEISVDFTEFNLDSITEGITNKYFTDERVDDRVAALLQGGEGIAVTYNDVANTLEISSEAPTAGFDLSNNTTADLSEDPSALYYTDTRARGAVSASSSGDGSLTYNSGTGVFTYTGPSAAQVRAHITAGTGVTITNGQVSIGQAVATTSDVTFNSVETDTIKHTGGTITLDPTGDGANTGDVVVAGNLTVNGTTTSVNSNEVNIGDSIIVLNADETAAPSQDGGIEIERGTAANVSFVWDETNDYWTLNNETLANVTIDGGSY